MTTDEPSTSIHSPNKEIHQYHGIHTQPMSLWINAGAAHRVPEVVWHGPVHETCHSNSHGIGETEFSTQQIPSHIAVEFTEKAWLLLY